MRKAGVLVIVWLLGLTMHASAANEAAVPTTDQSTDFFFLATNKKGYQSMDFEMVRDLTISLATGERAVEVHPGLYALQNVPLRNGYVVVENGCGAVFVFTYSFPEIDENAHAAVDEAAIGHKIDDTFQISLGTSIDQAEKWPAMFEVVSNCDQVYIQRQRPLRGFGESQLYHALVLGCGVILFIVIAAIEIRKQRVGAHEPDIL